MYHRLDTISVCDGWTDILRRHSLRYAMHTCRAVISLCLSKLQLETQCSIQVASDCDSNSYFYNVQHLFDVIHIIIRCINLLHNNVNIAWLVYGIKRNVLQW